MSTGSPHTDVGGYVLGVLDEKDNEAFERHLPACESCQDELRELYAVPAWLDLAREGQNADASAEGLETPAEAPAEASVTALADHTPRPARRSRHARSTRSRSEAAVRQRRQRVLATALAAAALLAAAVAGAQTWSLVRDSVQNDVTAVGLTADSQPAHLDGEVLSSRDPDTGAEGTLAVDEREWGSEVFLELGGVTGPLHCQLFAVSHDGDEEVVSSWQVAEGGGYGVPEQPEPLRIFGGTALDRSDLSRFEIRTPDETVVLTIPAS